MDWENGIPFFGISKDPPKIFPYPVGNILGSNRTAKGIVLGIHKYSRAMSGVIEIPCLAFWDILRQFLRAPFRILRD